MRLRTLLLLLCLLSAGAQAQVWEKLIAPGLTYRMELDSMPRMIHALRYSPGLGPTQALPELADGTVYDDSNDKGRESLASMVRRTGAVAGINADFFPFTGDPLGLMVRADELISEPYKNRSIFAWGRNYARSGWAQVKLTASVAGGANFDLDGINKECPINQMVLQTETSGLSVAKTPNVAVILNVVQGAWQVNTKTICEVEVLASDVTDMPIGRGKAVLVANGTRAAAVTSLRPGQRITFSISAAGLDWSKVDHAVAGGPMLVQDGQIAVDAVRQGFDAAFTDKRHPRTAIGRTKSGDIWFVAIDGRQTISIGATLTEMARIMQRLGCVDAINLDGGGSTTFNIYGVTLNKPSDGVERLIANGVLFYGGAPSREPLELQVYGPARLEDGGKAQLTVRTPDGRAISNSEILWAVSGPGWIDQGGLLRATGAGVLTVTAVVRGNFVQGVIEGVPKPR